MRGALGPMLSPWLDSTWATDVAAAAARLRESGTDPAEAFVAALAAHRRAPADLIRRATGG